MSDMFLGSQAPLYQNVRICRRSKTGKILEERYAKNRITRLMLFGIGKFLLGQFNDSSPDKIYEYIPRYLALGTNTPGDDAQIARVSTVSSVNDARLLNEITQSSTTGESEPVKRVWIAERNMCKLNTKFTDPFIKISIKTYISSKQYDGLTIGEAGLFSKEKDNNCLARVCFSPIVKNKDEVLDIQWDITLLSYGETKYAEKLEIENGNKISIPLRYTNKYFKEFDIGLRRNWATSTIGITNYNTDTESEEYTSLFKYDEDGNIENIDTKDNIKQKSGWYEYLKNLGIEDMFDTFFYLLSESKLNIQSNDGADAKYLISINNMVPSMFYFGNLSNNQMNDIINNDSLSVCMLYSEDKKYKDISTNVTYRASDNINEYIITDVDGDETKYKVIDNRFYKKSSYDKTAWEETNCFMYNGVIVDINQQATEYTYKDGIFYKTKITTNDSFTNQYLNYSVNSDDDKFYIYNIDSNNTIRYSNYSIDLNNDREIYFNGDDTAYHLSSDNYWVIGEYIKLTPIITPSNATDKSVSWSVQNKDTIKINFDGVVTAWNLGETNVVGSTINDLKAICSIDVVKDTEYISIDNIFIEPQEITLNVGGNLNQSIIVTANIDPIFATNASVIWTVSHELSQCITKIDLGNNQVKISLNNSGNTGSGYLTAISQSGKTANCLIRVLYRDDTTQNCTDESHLLQKGNH